MATVSPRVIPVPPQAPVSATNREEPWMCCVAPAAADSRPRYAGALRRRGRLRHILWNRAQVEDFVA
jgi:hypothetical protein